MTLGTWLGRWVATAGTRPPDLADEPRRLLLHMAGYDRYQSHRERDYVLVQPASTDGRAALALVAAGLAVQCGGPISWCAGDVCFRTTEAGQRAARLLAERGMW